jgi:hypothetical protein
MLSSVWVLSSGFSQKPLHCPVRPPAFIDLKLTCSGVVPQHSKAGQDPRAGLGVTQESKSGGCLLARNLAPPSLTPAMLGYSFYRAPLLNPAVRIPNGSQGRRAWVFGRVIRLPILLWGDGTHRARVGSPLQMPFKELGPTKRSSDRQNCV